MRILVRTLIVAVIASAPSVGFSKAAVHLQNSDASSPSSMVVVGSPSWTPDGQPQGGAELGFSPLSVTQSGIAYSPAATSSTEPVAGDQAKIADLPAWASSHFDDGHKRNRDPFKALGVDRFGSLSEPSAWALAIVGVALIGGALRGLIMANRRLSRLRSEDDLHE